MEECKSSDSVTVREFKRLRNNLELAQKEITKLKQNDAEIKNSESVRASISALANARVNGLINENDELKAMVELLKSKPMQPLINGRFKENKIVRHCLDAGGTDLNKICMINFSVEDREQFAQLIGYSHSGYGELSYVTDESYYRAEKGIEQAQCLQSVKATAIKDAIFNSEKVEFEGSHYIGTYVSLEDLEVNIKQLGDEL